MSEQDKVSDARVAELIEHHHEQMEMLDDEINSGEESDEESDEHDRELWLKLKQTKDALRELLALRQGWRDIASAPKDGRWILLGSYASRCMGYWDDDWRDQRGDMRGPTHWMPLPAPPARGEG